MTIKKLLIMFLSLTLIFAISCSNNLEPEASQSGKNADLIPDGGDGSIAAFINKYAGVYYRGEEGRVRYKLKDGKVYTINGLNEVAEIPVEKVSESEKKLQIRYADEGKVEVLKFIDKGYTAYTSYILEKVSDEVADGMYGVGGYVKEFAKYKGTYKSIEQNIENYFAIDGDGYIYFHDSKVTLKDERVGITEKELTIIETVNRTLRKIIFKFDQGVYREYNVDGNHIDRTGVFYSVTKDFIETLGDTIYTTADGNNSIVFNGAKNKAQGSVWSTGSYFTMRGGSVADNDNIGNVTVLKGNTLNIMKYRANLTFNNDYSVLTYVKNGQTIEFKKQ